MCIFRYFNSLAILFWRTFQGRRIIHAGRLVMKTSAEHRSSDRIPIGNRVKVMSNGKIVAYLVAINLSMGGILLSAQPNLRVGSTYEVAIQNGAEGAGLL